MRFRILGGLEVRDAAGRLVDLGGPKQRAVLAALLVAQGRPVSAAQLTDQVWGDDPPANPETSLQAYVSNLRRALEPDRKPREPARLLVTHAAGYALLAERADVDLTAFEDDVRAGRAALAQGDVAGARATLVAALERHSGPPLPELAGLPWVDEVASWVAALHRQALDARVEAGLLLAEHAELVPVLERAIVEHPYEERLRTHLALALYRGGRQRDALDTLASARRVLLDEVGVDLGPEARRLEQDILEQSPALDLSREVPRPGRAPATEVERAGAALEPSGAPGRREAARARDEAWDERPFIGRGHELEVLLAAATASAGGNGRPVVISGEPGIGKTRLVEELISRLPAATVVAWGRCPESAASAAYWPCIQIGRQLEGAGVIPTDLATQLLPADDVQPMGEDPTADRLHLHVAVAKMLAASTHPLVLVVDDLQWADASSLRVIEFIAGELRSTRALLVVTVRPVGIEGSGPLLDCLGEMARQPGAVRLDLDGLSGDDVRLWMAGRSAGAVDPRVAEVVHDRTGGNPFFVNEVVELLTADGRTVDADAVRRGSGVPAAVQDVVRRRVSRLPVPTQKLLSAASIVGRMFDLDVVAAVVEEPVPDLLDRIEPALDVGLIEDTDVPGRFQFSHALVAETLAAEVSSTRRTRLHARTALALARLRASDLEGHLADLAHHAVEGAIAGTAAEAYDWSTRAARQATMRLAHEEAAEHWQRATRALELARPDDAIGRYDALREEGLAWLRVDAVDAGYTALVRALDLACALGDTDRIATAAADMSIDGVWNTGEVALTSVDAVSSLERALAMLPETPTPQRVLAMSALSEAAYWVRPPELLDDLTARAVADARTLHDPLTLGRALAKRNQALWRAASFDGRAEAAEELFAMAEEHDLPPNIEAMARFGMGGVSWERADVASALQQAAQAQQIAHRLGSPALMTQVDWFVATLAAFRGRLQEAEALCDRAFELYRRTRRWSADTLDAGLRMSIQMEQGRIDEIRARRDVLLDSPYRPWFQEGYAYGLVQFGLVDEAADLLADAPLPPLIDSWLFLGLIGAATHVRNALGNREAVATLLELLRPYEGRLATTGTGSAFGDVHLALAAGLRFLGDHAAAAHHADRSVGVLTGAGAGPDLVRALLLRAELVPASADADRARAVELVERLDLPLLRSRLA
jgi:DNA-binding SARP family transcriptional activator